MSFQSFRHAVNKSVVLISFGWQYDKCIITSFVMANITRVNK